MTNKLAEAFPAGELLADELAARQWTQTEFAEILGRPVQFVSEIVQGKKEITRESAAQIGAALGTSAELWLNLQDTYFLWKQDQDPKAKQGLHEVATRARLNDLAPMAVLRKRGFIKGSTVNEQATELVELLGMKNLDGTPGLLSLAARRSNADAGLTSTQVAWVACTKKVASALAKPSPYKPDKLRELAPKITQLTRGEKGFTELPSHFAKVGVCLVYVDAFPGSKISGATYFDGKVPVIALSGHGRRLDKVIFTLLHEVAHLVAGDVKEGQQPLIDENDHDTVGDEDKADELAGTWVFPKPLPEFPERFTATWINDVANSQGVSAWLLLGHLQYQRLVPWRTMLAKGSPQATPYLEAWHSA